MIKSIAEWREKIQIEGGQCIASKQLVSGVYYRIVVKNAEASRDKYVNSLF